VPENNLYDNLNPLQKRLHDFAEECNITLLREDIPDWETRLAVLKNYIEVRYAESSNRSSS
jgi:hypothetical protein